MTAAPTETVIAAAVTVYEMAGFGVAWLQLRRIEQSRVLSLWRDVPMSFVYIECWPVILFGLAIGVLRKLSIVSF